jgi:hypothetical protein
MVIFQWYCLLAVTTGIAAMYELVEPVLTALEKLQPENSVLLYKNTARMTLFGMSILIAPAILPACLIPSWGDRFRKSLLDNLSQA